MNIRTRVTDPDWNSLRGYIQRGNMFGCPRCATGLIYIVEEQEANQTKDVCSNHTDASVYGIQGDRSCDFVRIYPNPVEKPS